VGGLPSPIGQAAGPNQAQAGFFESVVVALQRVTGVFGPGLLAQGLQQGGQGGGRGWGQIPGQPPGAAERDVQPQATLAESVVVIIGPGAAAAHLLGQRRQVG